MEIRPPAGAPSRARSISRSRPAVHVRCSSIAGERLPDAGASAAEETALPYTPPSK